MRNEESKDHSKVFESDEDDEVLANLDYKELLKDDDDEDLANLDF